MKTTAASFLIILSVFLSGCPKGEDTGNGIRKFSQTGVTPDVGEYAFIQHVRFSVFDDQITGKRSIRFFRDGLGYDVIPIQDGAFSFEHGEIDDTKCPTDGYAISGHFVNPVQAEGVVVYATDCDFVASDDFVVFVVFAEFN